MGKKNRTRSYYIPYDIIVDILPRLPVKSSLRFRCVAKSWNSLISSREFSKTNFHYLNKNSNFEYRMMLRNLEGGMKHVFLGNGLTEPTVRVFDTRNKFPIGCHFVGSCNGLICLAVNEEGERYPRDRVILWNPSIQATKMVPDFGVGDYDRVYGFGYNESRDDYKVVGFFFGTGSDVDVLVEIYSTKTGEFKRIQNHRNRWHKQNGSPPTSTPTFANGKIHWFEKGRYAYIAYLDLATEEYGKINLPVSVYHLIDPRMTALPGGYLYFSYYDKEKCRHFWLGEPSYGAGETKWNKYPAAYDHDLEKYLGYKTPSFVLDNGEIVSFYEAKIVVVNLEDCSARYPRLSCHQDFHWGIAYVESLVSPHWT